jgi:Undecaprenyl-phosphate galactose phosphotransferase WbaP
MSAVAEKVISAVPVRKRTQKSWLTNLCLAGSDFTAVSAAVALSLVVFRLAGHQPASLESAFLPATSALLLFAVLGLYPVVGLSPLEEFRRVLIGSSVGYGIAAGTLFLRLASDPRVAAAFTFSWAATVLLVLVFRAILRGTCSVRSWWGTPTVIFGSGETAHSVLKTLQTHSSLGLKVVAVFDNDYPEWPDLDKDRIYVGTPRYATEFAETFGVSHAVIAMADIGDTATDQLIRKHARIFKHLLVVPQIAGISSIWVESRDLGGVLGLHVNQTLMHRIPRMFKRLFDVVFTGFAGILLLPLFAIIYAVIRLSTPGPVFYGQNRIGRGGSTFTAWKVRSMLPNADDVLSRYLERDPELRREWECDRKLKNDPRITPIGRLLRKSSLDELPQLWNVLRGDMSLVGPRPIPETEIVRYRENSDVYEAYQRVRPGITGMWQVSGRNNTTYQERLEFDEYYIRNWSIWLDLHILARTFKTVLLGEGAY